jgi:hypothetical protein
MNTTRTGPQCGAVTDKGPWCRNAAVKDSYYCIEHQPYTVTMTPAQEQSR